MLKQIYKLKIDSSGESNNIEVTEIFSDSNNKTPTVESAHVN